MIVNSFYGGMKHGACLQFTPLTSENYSQLTRAEVVELRDALNVWLDEPELAQKDAALEAAREFMLQVVPPVKNDDLLQKYIKVQAALAALNGAK